MVEATFCLLLIDPGTSTLIFHEIHQLYAHQNPKKPMKVRAIITGVTGMVGEGVLHECLLDDNVEKVLIINRRPSGFTHPKLTEIVHKDFQDITPIQSQLSGYNACFFCLGVSSVGMNEEKYRKLTYDLTLHFANVVVSQSKDLTFCYVSGKGTDGTEKGGLMWARVKGKTENDLMKLPFKKVYAFRPGFMKPTPGLKNPLSGYKYFNWMFPLLRALFPNAVCTLREVGIAMIKCAQKDCGNPVLEVKDIVRIANS
jgi:hypothetical protein